MRATRADGMACSTLDVRVVVAGFVRMRMSVRAWRTRGRLSVRRVIVAVVVAAAAAFDLQGRVVDPESLLQPRAGEVDEACQRQPAPSWLTTVAPLSMRS